MAQLPLRAMCGASGPLSRKYGSGRSAEQSKAFHAHIAGQPEASKLMALLTDEERDEILTWHKPTDVVIEGDLLDYASSDKEVELALDQFGQPCDFEDPNALIRGRMDFGWVRNDLAYVEDVKRSVWTTPEGPDSLQLHAYGHAYARLHEVPGYCTGIWAATEGEHIWSSEVVMFGSEKQERIWERIYHAAKNETGKYTTGPHCKQCFARLHCEEFLLPAATLTAANLADPNSGALLDPSAAGEMVERVQRLMDLGERYLDNLKEHVRRGQLKVLSGNKMWAPVTEKRGRESIDKEKLAQVLNGDLSKVMTRGEPRTSFRWVNAR